MSRTTNVYCNQTRQCHGVDDRHRRPSLTPPLRVRPSPRRPRAAPARYAAGRRNTHSEATQVPSTPITNASRAPHQSPNQAPATPPNGMVPHTRNRVVAFIRPSRCLAPQPPRRGARGAREIPYLATGESWHIDICDTGAPHRNALIDAFLQEDAQVDEPTTDRRFPPRTPPRPGRLHRTAAPLGGATRRVRHPRPRPDRPAVLALRRPAPRPQPRLIPRRTSTTSA